jgi:hypothetical protein
MLHLWTSKWEGETQNKREKVKKNDWEGGKRKRQIKIDKSW